jgi:predicted negative regulator of RcsB-dependent stress response
MPRRRLKHKQVIETIEQDDLQYAWDKVKTFWSAQVRPYEGLIWTVSLAVLAVVVGFYWWRNSQTAQISDANLVLAQARSDFQSGDIDGAKSELNKVLPGGEYSQRGIGVAADMVAANIACASGEYDTAITILTRVIPQAPKNLKTDLLYQLSTAQESKGDFSGALQSLEEVTSTLGKEPDESNPDRESSVWDRYYFHKGRLLSKLKKEEEGVKYLLKVGKRSAWHEMASREISWQKSSPVEGMPVHWNSAPKT